MGLDPRNHSKRYRNSSQHNSADRWQLQRRRFADNIAANNLLPHETTRQGLLRQGNPEDITRYHARNGFLDTLVEPISQAVRIKLSLQSAQQTDVAHCSRTRLVTVRLTPSGETRFFHDAEAFAADRHYNSRDN